MDFPSCIWQAVVTVDSNEFFICLKAAECKITDFEGRSLAVPENRTKFVKEKTEVQKYCSLFQKIKSPFPVATIKKGLFFFAGLPAFADVRNTTCNIAIFKHFFYNLPIV
jgi:hypothetical protein